MVLRNCRLFDGEVLYDERKDLFIEGAYIKRIENTSENAFSNMAEDVIECDGNLILPGFQNAHAHAPMTFLRSQADDLPLNEWLNKQVFPAEAKLTSEDIYWLTKLAICEYVANGITSSYEMYYHPESVAKACVDMDYEMVINGTILGDCLDDVNLLKEYYKTYNHYHEAVSFTLGFHAEYTTSLKMMEGIAALSNELKAPVAMHIQETKKEVMECVMRYGVTPTKLFDQIGLWNYGGSGFHFVYNEEEDYEILKNRRIVLVTNPASNMKLASGIAPIHEMIDKNLCVAIGTDGPASNNCLSMFREMYLVAGLQKLLLQDAKGIDALHVLKMACLNGAKAMHLPKHNGLKENEIASLCMIDLQRPNMQPENHILKNLVYSGSDANIVMTMVRGKMLYQGGTYYFKEDVKEIIQKANEISRRILG